MRAVKDHRKFPDVPWTKWRDLDDFSFESSFYLHEHPAMSQLAKATKYQDFCPYEFAHIFDCAAVIWTEEICSNDNAPKHVRDIAKKSAELLAQLDAIKNEKLPIAEQLYPEDVTKVSSSEFFESVNSPDVDKSLLLSEYSTLTGREEKIAYDELFPVTTDLIVAIVRTGYAPREDVVWSILARLLADEEPERREYFYDSSDNPGGLYSWYFEYLIDSKYTSRHKAYETSLILWPADNVADVVNDAIVSMNFIQRIVRHDNRDDEKDVAISGVLREGTPAERTEAVEKFISRRDEWTT